MAWEAVPEPVRERVHELLGAPVVEAVTQPGGFSPGVAARVVLGDGRRAFVKAVGVERDRFAVELVRREAETLSGMTGLALPRGVAVSELVGVVDDGGWIALVLADVDGRPPALPWREDELARVFDAVHALGGALTPAPFPVPTVAEVHGGSLRGFRELAADPERAMGLPVWARENLAGLAELESGWEAVSVGDTLLHQDLRADNLLLTADRVVVVDWAHACRGAPWLDALFMMPSVLMQGVVPSRLSGATEPERWWARHPASHGVEPASVDAGLAAITGFFLGRSLLPPPPALPSVRDFQRAQGEAGLAWLRQRVELRRVEFT